MHSFENQLTTLQLQLPTVATSLANYLPCTIVGSLLFVSGQLPYQDGKIAITGQLGSTVSEEKGIEAARHCMLNILAQARAKLGSLDRIKRCVKLTGFVSATPNFTAHPKIINGASDLIVAILGEAGKHARAAVGVSSLPLGAAVEIEAIFEIAAE